ncbi:MAG TPA: RNA 2',3'-cyclic phosphodiesterase [Clostridia bacterium]|nr:RNA 2',3'-cyclic phosphodiesterase [Clostridia bacterium]
MRLFAGIDIDEPIRQNISRFVDNLRRQAPDVRFVGPETYHITLKFIGETGEFDRIREALRSATGPAFDIAFRGTGFFPDAKSPRIFWAGIHAGPQLAGLAAAVSSALEPLGFEGERGPYRPHLTLARSGSGSPRPRPGDRANPKFQRIQQALASGEEIDFGTMTAREFFLYESKLSPRGAQYFKRERYELR